MVTVWCPLVPALLPDPGFAVVQPESAMLPTAVTAKAARMRRRAAEENTRCAVNFELLFELTHDAGGGGACTALCSAEVTVPARLMQALYENAYITTSTLHFVDRAVPVTPARSTNCSGVPCGKLRMRTIGDR